MKRIIRKFWGVALIVILLSTMFVGGAVVPGASANTLAWSTVGQIWGQFVTYQLNGAAPLAAESVLFTKVAANGDVFAVDAAGFVYRSTTGGLTWTKTAVAVAAGIVDLEISPSYATDHTVFVLGTLTGNAQVYISTNYGANFAVLGGSCGVGEVPTSLAIAPNYASGTGEVMVGTENPAAATYGDVYIWGKNGVLNWAAQLLGQDVTSLSYSPNYLIDSTRVVVSATAVAGLAGGILLHTLVGNNAWDFNLGGFSCSVETTIGDIGPGAAVSTTLALPSDFNASSVYARTCFVGVVTTAGAVDNIYRVTCGVGAPLVAGSTGVKMGPPTWAATMHVETASMVYAGTYASGTLYYGVTFAALVLSNAAPMGAAPTSTWGISVGGTPPAGAGGLTGTGPVYIALASDYATSGKLYAGTSGAAEGALSVSSDHGAHWVQAGLINTDIATIDDFAAASATEYYMVTTSSIGNTSLWRTTNSGAAWYRYLEFASTLTGIVRLSPSYATDKTVFVGDVTGTFVFMSNNNASDWMVRTSPNPIGDIAVKDQYTLYVGDCTAGFVTSTANGGWTWAVAATTTYGGPVVSLKVNVATGAILAGSKAGGAGSVSISLDGNLTYIPLGGVGIGPDIVAFDANYATNKLIYAADAANGPGVDGIWGTIDDVLGGTTGIWRYWFGTSVNWGLASVDGGLCFAPRAIMVAPDGTLYASDNAPGDGVVRILHPEDPFNLLTKAELVNGLVDDGLPANALFTQLSLAQGSNIVFAIDALPVVPGVSAPIIKVYTDTMAMGSTPPAPVSPAAASVLTNPNTVTFSFSAVPGAWFYQVQYDSFADWRSATGANTAAVGDTSVTVTTLLAGVTYYWRVRVMVPVFSPWSATNTFTTEMGIAPPNQPVGLNADGVVVGATLSPVLQWNAIKAATGYEVQMSATSDMSNPIVDLTGANALGPVNAYKYTGTLDYNTTYYFKVRALTSTSVTDWSGVVAFTTISKPTTAPPVVTVPPAVTTSVVVSVPPATSVVITQAPEKTINPSYIWAIIIIGAVLVLAVIVLIVRTRRPV